MELPPGIPPRPALASKTATSLSLMLAVRVDDQGRATLSPPLRAQGYLLQWSSCGRPWGPEPAVRLSAGSGQQAVSHTVKHLHPGTCYTFRCSAVNPSGRSAFSYSPAYTTEVEVPGLDCMDHADLVALAESGDSEAQFNVGLRHYWGLHQVLQDDVVARRYFTLCGNQALQFDSVDDGAHLMAFAALAVMCFAGYGGVADKDEGKRWAQHALKVSDIYV